MRETSKSQAFLPLGRSLSPREPNSKQERIALVVLFFLSLSTLAAIAVFYLLNPRDIIGDSLVNSINGNPLEIPPAATFPFYVKPITIFFVSVIVFSYCGLSLCSRFIRSRFPTWLSVLFIVFSIVALGVCAYEVLFNFALWTSILVNQPNPDHAVNSFPVGNAYRINLVFATKSFVAYLFVSYFALATFKKSVENAKT